MLKNWEKQNAYFWVWHMFIFLVRPDMWVKLKGFYFLSHWIVSFHISTVASKKIKFRGLKEKNALLVTCYLLFRLSQQSDMNIIWLCVYLCVHILVPALSLHTWLCVLVLDGSMYCLLYWYGSTEKMRWQYMHI